MGQCRYRMQPFTVGRNCIGAYCPPSTNHLSWVVPTGGLAVMLLEPRTCEPCGRAFIPSSCPDHCGPSCCRRRSCTHARPTTRNPDTKYRTCIVCGRSNARFPFERFATCNANCSRLRVNGRQGLGATKVRVWYCQGVWMPGMEHLHRPGTKPRVHIKYCSLKCWSLPESGSEARARLGERRRHSRYWAKFGNKSTYLTEMRRIRARNARLSAPPLPDLNPRPEKA